MLVFLRVFFCFGDVRCDLESVFKGVFFFSVCYLRLVIMC